MRMYDLIAKKRDRLTLTSEEINFMIENYVALQIPDYQMSAMLMAIYLNGMNDHELTDLTNAVAQSGDIIDLSPIDGIKVDKHSTGGVGDKTTLIVAPIVAACGVKVAKMSGRGLGHTGGTIDKLESIPGLKVTLSSNEFFDIVNRIGFSIIGQSGNITPADKMIYALRDVTATVESIPLIASSIMSKKLASGSDCILLDVKVGSGAFMKTTEDAVLLAQKMVAIGEQSGKKTIALVTDMDIPLGNTIGNSLEVIEAVDVLNGYGPTDLREVSLTLACNMLMMAGKGSYEQCYAMAERAIQDKTALKKLVDMVDVQGGDSGIILDTSKFNKAKYSLGIKAMQDGYISRIDTEGCGKTSVVLGAGRKTKLDQIDYQAGIILNKKVGDTVTKGCVIATLYANNNELLQQGQDFFSSCMEISSEMPTKKPLILARIV